MQGQSRFWMTVATAGVLVALGVTARSAVLLTGGVGLGAWALTHQFAFVSRSSAVTGMSISLRSESSWVEVEEFTQVYVLARLETASPFALWATPELPASSRRSSSEPLGLVRVGEESGGASLDVASRVVKPLDVGPVKIGFRDPSGFFVDSLTRHEHLIVDVRSDSPRRLHVGLGGKTVGILDGEHQSGRTGAGIDPYEVRKYAPGDRLSRIDWKATARLAHPHVREYEQTEAYRTALVVDHRSSMSAGRVSETKLDHLREVALGFVGSAAHFGDPLGLYTVGNGGATTARHPMTGADQYESVKQIIRGLETTDEEWADEEEGGSPISPSRARTIAKRLTEDESKLGRTLRPYFGSSETYVRHLRNRPLFRTAQLVHSQVESGSWAIILTDDSNPTEIREAVKLVRRNGWHVLVFLAPAILYGTDEPDIQESAYSRYRDFETFRRSLARLDRVSAFEVGPNDRVEAVIDRHNREEQRRRENRIVGTDESDTQSRRDEGVHPEPTTESEDGSDE